MMSHLKQESAIRALREFTAWLPRWCGVCGVRILFTKTWEEWVHTPGWVETLCRGRRGRDPDEPGIGDEIFFSQACADLLSTH